ncbi:parathyroid hormone/parathyroid hormone-related peptide receptor-like isoform X2 [Neocloeon triangulifer]|uniref:parathyroid hormone/parathyroid hormone-related peptide receptor-like isoform X2 n=1 Tax=Neocloeon triangulifer TaxID=2078957 RepID=UPI00286ED23B|nr:parathyroid hormone/parathyroid hormone-related peptide receptor-like isoform X2 [Neocloeon triangulifer]
MELTDNMGPIFTSPEDQTRILQLKAHECLRTQLNASIATPEDHCPPVWDGIMCWPATPPGQLVVLPCANYIAGFEYQGNASRLCTNDSSWFVNKEHNTDWTNYSMCYKTPLATVVIKLADMANLSHTMAWMPILKPVVHVGFGFSLLSLLIAFGILATTKKLRCPRNTLHMHLFSSFILRASMGLLKDSLFIEGVGMDSDIVVKGNDTFFSQQEKNWACKSVTSLWQFALVANYSWILMEGLYLHNLIFLALFSDSSAITLHVVLGWGMPVVVVGSWVIIRAALENDFCWTTQSTYVSLIIRIPIVVSILINFVFFLNIIRVLFLKLKSCISEETRRYRKWAKSTLVLVPLFGVQYVLSLVLSCFTKDNPNVELLWLFADQVSSSFQGFCVAVLYCFLNAEVRTELSKKWMRSPWRQKKSLGKGGRNSSRGWRLRWSRSSYATSNVSIECRRAVAIDTKRPAVCVPLCEEITARRENEPKRCRCDDACECEEEAAVIEI